MTVYEPYASGYDYYESFDLYNSKELAIKRMHREAKKHNNKFKALYTDDDEHDKEMLRLFLVHWEGAHYKGEMKSFYVRIRRVIL